MAFVCLNTRARGERIERAHAGQLRLVEDAGGAGWGPERSPALGGSTPEGPGDSVESLETYVRSLRPGASCFCCGGVLKAQRGTGRRLLLVCPSCGSEAERAVGE